MNFSVGVLSRITGQVNCRQPDKIIVAQYLDGKAEDMVNAAKYNDDRLGRCLDALFRADRQSLMSDTSVSAIKIHNLLMTRIHNDSTTVSFAGAYKNQSPAAIQLNFGYNKDHRPDYKQIVFGLNITEDGHVPISYQLFNGNQADVNTHIFNWDSLRKFLATEDFFYIADSKLCSEDNLHHIEKTMASSSQSCQKTVMKPVHFMNDSDKEKILNGNLHILQTIVAKKGY